MWNCNKLHFACFAGLCAAAASVFGKLSGLPALENSIILRILCFSLMVFFNASVWTLFVKALHQSESSLLATVISTTSNFLFSAFMGYIIFQETTSLVWWSGLFLILGGSLLVIYDREKTVDINKAESTTKLTARLHED